MARTFRKAWIADRNPFMKNQAARKIRRISPLKEVPQGNLYRRYSEQWGICDWRHWMPHPSERRLNCHFHPWESEFREQWFQKELVQYKILTGNRRAHRPRPKKRGIK